ncbi:metal-dependent transcriptional regulator [bacterium]|nr:metal-dependent transcriptional regulator [bacterium]
MNERTGDRNLTSTQEDYLEAILELTAERAVARNMELSSKLGVRRATVTRALKLLTQKGLVNHEMNGYVTLTEEGKVIAQDILARHELFKHFFRDILNLEEDEADEIACKIEHTVSGNALNKFRLFIKRADECEGKCPNSLKLKKEEA